MLSGIQVGKRKRQAVSIEPKGILSSNHTSAQNASTVKQFTEDINQSAAVELRAMLNTLKVKNVASKSEGIAEPANDKVDTSHVEDDHNVLVLRGPFSLKPETIQRGEYTLIMRFINCRLHVILNFY